MVRIISKSGTDCILEKCGDDIFTVVCVVSDLMTCSERNRLLKAKFLRMGRHFIPLEKIYNNSFATSGYWGPLPSHGDINADRQIRHEDEGYIMFYEIVDGVARCYVSYSPDYDEISERVGEIHIMSYFGIDPQN